MKLTEIQRTNNPCGKVGVSIPCGITQWKQTIMNFNLLPCADILTLTVREASTA